jgi:hypothetical protein
LTAIRYLAFRKDATDSRTVITSNKSQTLSLKIVDESHVRAFALPESINAKTRGREDAKGNGFSSFLLRLCVFAALR